MTNRASRSAKSSKWQTLISSRSWWDSLQDSLEAMSVGLCFFPDDDDDDPFEYFLSDEEALSNDWEVIGKDMHIALNKVLKDKKLEE